MAIVSRRPVPQQILVTGACGLVGRAMTLALSAAGFTVRGFDPRATTPRERGDVRDPDAVRGAVDGCDGVLHLGAVSRVVWGERDPAQCYATNVEGSRNVLAAAAASRMRPWVVVASSREVYGQAETLPVPEDAPRRPMNVYGRSKLAAEDLAQGARRDGVRAAVARLSNVYGSPSDHRDRVVPAFARAAAAGAPLRVEGLARLYDFTHIDDVTRGLMALVDRLSAGEAPPPPIHFVSGTGTTLGELARLAVAAAGSASAIVAAPHRDYDVARFQGDPRQALAVLGWRAQVALAEGIRRLIAAFREDGRR
jgi:nucleoside-diphosphate-sugar epimerase